MNPCAWDHKAIRSRKAYEITTQRSRVRTQIPPLRPGPRWASHAQAPPALPNFPAGRRPCPAPQAGSGAAFRTPLQRRGPRRRCLARLASRRPARHQQIRKTLQRRQGGRLLLQQGQFHHRHPAQQCRERRHPPRVALPQPGKELPLLGPTRRNSSTSRRPGARGSKGKVTSGRAEKPARRPRSPCWTLYHCSQRPAVSINFIGFLNYASGRCRDTASTRSVINLT